MPRLPFPVLSDFIAATGGRHVTRAAHVAVAAGVMAQKDK
jgi:hypothetical protein